MPHYKEPGDDDFNSEINIISHHHPNMLSPILFKHMFNVLFNILDIKAIDEKSPYNDHAYLLEKKSA